MEKLRWKRIHKGLHIHSDGQRVKQGEILMAHPLELSDVVKAAFVCLDDASLGGGEDSAGIRLIARPSSVVEGKYDLVNPLSGALLNNPENPMAKDEVVKIADIQEGLSRKPTIGKKTTVARKTSPKKASGKTVDATDIDNFVED